MEQMSKDKWPTRPICEESLGDHPVSVIGLADLQGSQAWMDGFGGRILGLPAAGPLKGEWLTVNMLCLLI